MADYYYELHDSAVSENCSKYHVAYSRSGDAMMAGGYHMTSLSERVWVEDSTGVRFVKNRFQALGDPIDLKEFMWIKLKAQEFKGA